MNKIILLVLVSLLLIFPASATIFASSEIQFSNTTQFNTTSNIYKPCGNTTIILSTNLIGTYNVSYQTKGAVTSNAYSILQKNGIDFGTLQITSGASWVTYRETFVGTLSNSDVFSINIFSYDIGTVSERNLMVNYSVQSHAQTAFDAVNQSNSSLLPTILKVFSIALLIFAFGIIFIQLNSEQPSPSIIFLGIITAIIGFGMLLLGNYLLYAIMEWSIN